MIKVNLKAKAKAKAKQGLFSLSQKFSKKPHQQTFSKNSILVSYEVIIMFNQINMVVDNGQGIDEAKPPNLGQGTHFCTNVKERSPMSLESDITMVDATTVNKSF